MIVCLGWGSLIWNPKDLPVDDWHADGPELPVEFARISKDGRLTLVVADGTAQLPVLWTRLSVRSLDEAVSALADREDIRQENTRYSIGVWSPARSSRHKQAETVGAWAAAQEIEAVVWTALKPGFPDSRGVVPSCDEALTHLRGLDDEATAIAEEYVRRTPAQIRTAYRTAIEQAFGWTPL
jgi:hypothetical protein